MQLPNDILLDIKARLSPCDLTSLFFTNRRLYSMLSPAVPNVILLRIASYLSDPCDLTALTLINKYTRALLEPTFRRLLKDHKLDYSHWSGVWPAVK